MPRKLVHFTPASGPAEVEYDRLADVVLELAAEAEAADERIKRAVLDAARRGDVDRVRTIVERWLVEPPAEIAATL